MYRLELKIPPALLVLLFTTAMWSTARISPWATIEIPCNVEVAIALSVIGFVVIITGIATFASARTTVNPMTPELATSLVTNGIYKLSRNPMYVGFFLILAAWVVFLENILLIMFLPLFVLYMNRFQIMPEEKALLTNFGDQYLAYLRSVRRWI